MRRGQYGVGQEFLSSRGNTIKQSQHGSQSLVRIGGPLRSALLIAFMYASSTSCVIGPTMSFDQPFSGLLDVYAQWDSIVTVFPSSEISSPSDGDSGVNKSPGVDEGGSLATGRDDELRELDVEDRRVEEAEDDTDDGDKVKVEDEGTEIEELEVEADDVDEAEIERDEDEAVEPADDEIEGEDEEDADEAAAPVASLDELVGTAFCGLLTCFDGCGPGNGLGATGVVFRPEVDVVVGVVTEVGGVALTGSLVAGVVAGRGWGCGAAPVVVAAGGARTAVGALAGLLVPVDIRRPSGILGRRGDGKGVDG